MLGFIIGDCLHSTCSCYTVLSLGSPAYIIRLDLSVPLPTPSSLQLSNLAHHTFVCSDLAWLIQTLFNWHHLNYDRHINWFITLSSMHSLANLLLLAGVVRSQMAPMNCVSSPSCTVTFTQVGTTQIAPTSTVWAAMMTTMLNVVDCRYCQVTNVQNNQAAQVCSQPPWISASPANSPLGTLHRQSRLPNDDCHSSWLHARNHGHLQTRSSWLPS